MSVDAVTINRVYVDTHYGTKPNDKFKIQKMPLFADVVGVSLGVSSAIAMLSAAGAGIMGLGLSLGAPVLTPLIALAAVAGTTALIALTCFMNYDKIAKKCITLTPNSDHLHLHPQYYEHVRNNIDILIKSGAVSKEAIYRIIEKREEYSIILSTYNDNIARLKQQKETFASETNELNQLVIQLYRKKGEPTTLESLFRRIEREIPNAIAELDREINAESAKHRRKQVEFLAYAHDAEITNQKGLWKKAEVLDLKLNAGHRALA